MQQAGDAGPSLGLAGQLMCQYATLRARKADVRIKGLLTCCELLAREQHGKQCMVCCT